MEGGPVYMYKRPVHTRDGVSMDMYVKSLDLYITESLRVYMCDGKTVYM